MTVYFAEEIGTGNIKIGFTEHGDAQGERIDDALTMTSHQVIVRAKNEFGSKADEKDLHFAFGKWRITRCHNANKTLIKTEFFRPSAELWAFIAYVDKHGDYPCKLIYADKFLDAVLKMWRV